MNKLNFKFITDLLKPNKHTIAQAIASSEISFSLIPPRPSPTASLSLYTGYIFPLFTFAMSKLKVFVTKSMTALTMFKVEN